MTGLLAVRDRRSGALTNSEGTPSQRKGKGKRFTGDVFSGEAHSVMT